MSSQHIRRIFFWLLVLIFFVATTLVSFYSMGYRFSFERGIFIHSGSITIKSNPRSIEISLDNKPVPQKRVNFINNSYQIGSIKPGEHQLSVKAPSFQSWSKKIKVRSGISTEFWNVWLARENYQHQFLHSFLDQKFYVSPDSRYIAFSLSQQDENLTIGLLEIEKLAVKEILNLKKTRLGSQNRENIIWSPNSEALLVNLEDSGSGVQRNLLFKIKKESWTNLNEVTEKKAMHFLRWDTEEKNIIYFLSEENLFLLSLETGEVKRLAENVMSYNLALDKIFYLQKSSGIINFFDKKNILKPEQLTTLSPAMDKESSYEIIPYDKERVVLADYTKGTAYIWNKGEKGLYFEKLPAGERLQGIQFSDDGKKVLFWNEKEIFVYFSRDWNVQPYRRENEIIELTRFLKPIKNVQWAQSYEHVIFSVDNRLKIIEIDRRDHCNIFDLIELKSQEASVISWNKNRKVFFTDKNPSATAFNLYFFNFPEKEGFLELF